MFNIYCLINPIDKKPFYVGVTVGKIHNRLSGHISEIKTYAPKYYNDKMKFISDIVDAGFKPKVRLLKTVSIHEVDYYEHFFYTMLLNQGYYLIQTPTAFSYSKKYTTDKNKIQSKMINNQQVIKYMQHDCKNNR